MIISFENDVPVITGTQKQIEAFDKLILNEVKEIRSKLRKQI